MKGIFSSKVRDFKVLTHWSFQEFCHLVSIRALPWMHKGVSQTHQPPLLKLVSQKISGLPLTGSLNIHWWWNRWRAWVKHIISKIQQYQELTNIWSNTTFNTPSPSTSACWKTRLRFYFICYLANPWSTLGHCWRGGLIDLLLTSVCYLFNRKITGSLVTKLGSKVWPSTQFILNQGPSDSESNVLTK